MFVCIHRCIFSVGILCAAMYTCMQTNYAHPKVAGGARKFPERETEKVSIGLKDMHNKVMIAADRETPNTDTAQSSTDFITKKLCNPYHSCTW